MKSYKENILMRSVLFVPAYNKKYIEKAIQCDADVIVLDLEDSVPPMYREEARNNVKRYFQQGGFQNKQVYIRINEIGTIDFIEDIKNLVFEDLNGYMPSKIYSADDIVFLDKYLNLVETEYRYEKGKFKLIPLIETAEAVNQVEKIAESSTRMQAICLGSEDYLNDIHCTYIHFQKAIQYSRYKIVNAARAAGILPIDTPYLELEDFEGYEKEETQMYKLGFAGNLLINPKQIAYANRCFSPSEEEIEFSEKIISVADKAKKERKSGIAVYDGIMIGPPMIKRAEMVLHLRNLIKNKG